MRLKLWMAATVVAATAMFADGPANAAPITFEFLNNSEFDNNAPAGTTMTRDDGDGTSATITIIDAWDNANGVTKGTSIHSSHGLLVTPGGMNPGDYFILSFDKDVIIDFLNFASFAESDGDAGRITIGANDPWDFDQSTLNSSDDIDDPFNGLVITSGTNIKFEGLASLTGGTSDWRLYGMDVSVVPEPSSIVLLSVAGISLAAVARRRRIR